jgi:3-hydroxyacyl-CoA dehydrogenase
MVERRKVVILGSNGTMGAGAAVVFAGAGFEVVMLAREPAKARAGIEAAKRVARSEAVAERIEYGSYREHLARAVAQADIVFEALAEELELKRAFFAEVDRWRKPEALVASNSSGLSMAEMAAGHSLSFRRCFLGIHLFNPPHLVVGAEVVPNPESDPEVVEQTAVLLARRLGRKVIVAGDQPGFVGNRVGLKVLNEVAQLAVEHGVALMDYLVGPHTGRSMPPLKTIDLIGWDVHKAIVANIYARCPEDPARDSFRLPQFIEHGVAAGRLGVKTPAGGGFYRQETNGTLTVLDPASAEYRPYRAPAPVGFVEAMRRLNRIGRYREAVAVMADAQGAEAELLRRLVLGYLSYGLGLCGGVARTAADVDTIMGYGFNWAPPGALVDLLGARRTVELLERHRLAVPAVVERAAANGERLCGGGPMEYGRTLVG